MRNSMREETSRGALVLAENMPSKFSVEKLSKLDWYILGISVSVLVFTSISSYFEKYHISVPLSFWGQEKVLIPLSIFILLVTLVLGYTIFLFAIPLHLSWMHLLCAFQRTKYYQSRINFWILFRELLFFLKRYGLIVLFWGIYLACRCYKGYPFLTWMMIVYSLGISIIYGGFLVFLVPFQRKVISRKVSKDMKCGLLFLFRARDIILSLNYLLFFTLLVLELVKKAYPSLFSGFIFQISAIGIVLLSSIFLAWYVSIIARGFENVSLRVFTLLTVFLSFIIGHSPIGAQIGKSGLYLMRTGGDIPVVIGVKDPGVCATIASSKSEECLAYLILETDRILVVRNFRNEAIEISRDRIKWLKFSGSRRSTYTGGR